VLRFDDGLPFELCFSPSYRCQWCEALVKSVKTVARHTSMKLRLPLTTSSRQVLFIFGEKEVFGVKE
jgi:hypothetical protein